MSNIDHRIIGSLLKSRDAYERVYEHLDKDDLVPEARLILEEIRNYYERDIGAKACDIGLVEQFSVGRVQGEKLSNRVRAMIQSSIALDPSPENVVQAVLDAKKHTLGLRLAAELARGNLNAEGRRLLEQYTSLTEATDLNQEETEELNNVPLSDIVRVFRPEGLIKVAPKALNDRLGGGVRPGHHILVFAPTEMGKSLFSINMTRGFLAQGLPTLYVGNEDPAPDLIMRLVTRLTGMTRAEILTNPEEAQEKLSGTNYDRFVLASLSPGSFPQVKSLVKKYQPRVVIIDQLRNMEVKSDNRTNQLERLATEARNLAKRYNLVVVSITQAADSASGKRILSRGDVDGSNVGIPGQADVMVGIGADAEMEERNERVLSFPKNKLSGDHTPVYVTIDPQLSKVY